MKSSRKHAKHKKHSGIPKKQLKQLLKTLPNISETQLQKIRPHVAPQTYKRLKKLSGFISQDIINDLRKEAGSLVQMASELTSEISNEISQDVIDDLKKDMGSFAQMAGELAMDSDIRFSDLEEDKGGKS
ncbi:hypothetical protein BKN38_05615 [Helicobacter sp. CLO-3]|uniref:hypothetical protein n=1 Tax=unclassified Helicobacter TaxID=2593540 RepID=UPI000804B2B3|nr:MULTISPECIES: hypothetical protein [unclassified Helicobacter]OBV29993.1 hypothetical protein BA723_03330 [Helicobacter sp. CLO-3]OHU83186.1 hypothetical protein BKN38_05615 [Helicobacter sp. CLO-3]